MQTFDLVIRGGTIVDGKRNPRFTGDVAIKDGNVASIGKTHHAVQPSARSTPTG